jgi:hypothetical protein
MRRVTQRSSLILVLDREQWTRLCPNPLKLALACWIKVARFPRRVMDFLGEIRETRVQVVEPLPPGTHEAERNLDRGWVIGSFEVPCCGETLVELADRMIGFVTSGSYGSE